MTTDEYREFKKICDGEIDAITRNQELQQASLNWMNLANEARYSYHFEWLGRPIIQYPQDMIAIQEIIWSTKPDLIIETGIAHGGSLILSASLLALMDLADSKISSTKKSDKRRVIGIDIDIRQHNMEALQQHFLFDRIELYEGSSTDIEVLNQVRSAIESSKRVMVILDSNHTEQHVYAELLAYSKFVTRGCYMVVLDTIVQFLKPENPSNRPWGPNNNPYSALRRFLEVDRDFVIDEKIHNKLLISVAPSGYLKRV